MNSTAESVIDTLLEGNRRFAGSLLNHPHQDDVRRRECLAGQKPVAAVVGCADSRIPPEVIFDCGIGDIFVIRVAGTVMDSAVVASVEYAVEHLNVPLVMVMGHSSCGAITAAVKGAEADGELRKLLSEIRNDFSTIPEVNIGRIEGVIREYTVAVTRKLAGLQPVIISAVSAGACAVVPAYYSMETGVVEMLDNGHRA